MEVGVDVETELNREAQEIGGHFPGGVKAETECILDH